MNESELAGWWFDNLEEQEQEEVILNAYLKVKKEEECQSQK